MALLCGLVPAQAIDRLNLRVADVVNPGFALHDIQAVFDAGAGTAVVSVGRARAGARLARDVRLRCGRAALSFEGLTCHNAELRVAGKRVAAVFDLEMNLRSGRTHLVAALGQGRVEVLREDDGSVHVGLVEVAAEGLLALLQIWSPELVRGVRDLKAVGSASGEIDWTQSGSGGSRLGARLRFANAGFGTADGLRAAEKVGVELAVDARQAGETWHWEASADWRQGAAYLHPLYLEAGPRFSARGRLDGERLRVERADVELEGVRRLSATATANLDALADGSISLEVEGADLALIGPRWIAPLLAPASADRMRFSGHMTGALRLQQGHVQAIEGVFEDAGFSLAGVADGAGVALGPVAGRVSWVKGKRSNSHLEIAGGRWEKLTLGAFVIDAELMDDSVQFARTTVPVLDGALVLDGLSLSRGQSGWQGSGSVVIEPVSMPALTAALELPLMSGVLSASLPGLRVSPGEIALDGALVISVFDGYVHATGLRLREPFGVASHLSADIEARHIDLAQLTETFSFGSITGFVDADVRGLELARWRPVGFDARIVSSPGDYRRRISQRAVQNIGALGGAGAIAAIQRSLLRVFDTFGYSELGLHCRLAGGVCLMDGIEGGARADGGFVIVRGGGVPALDVIGYNRRVDWDELVNRLQRVIAENVAPELR
ncbi:hypothetical protein [Thauera sp.]|uniref:hypothetical protein n=1 Tax=Thauera sp. TaxID=1905334 RepID=UPI002A362456|nr:hypothetical protein [Thauera sp.]MDX9884955.1 hypothetical protein [Thauera sp.]